MQRICSAKGPRKVGTDYAGVVSVKFKWGFESPILHSAKIGSDHAPGTHGNAVFSRFFPLGDLRAELFLCCIPANSRRRSPQAKRNFPVMRSVQIAETGGQPPEVSFDNVNCAQNVSYVASENMNFRKLCVLPLMLLLGTCAALSGQAAEASNDAALRQAPRVLSPQARSINRLVPNVEFQDLDGLSHHLGELAQQQGLLVFVTSTSCPISRRYLPTLVELAKKHSSEGFGILLVNPMATDKPDAIRDAAKALGSAGLYVHDKDGELCRALQATSTTDVLLIDSARSVRYQGAIDDQYGFGYSLPAPRTTYLATAIAEYLKGDPIAIAATEAPGCRLDLEPRETIAASVTYHNRISRIVQSNCLKCHREGGVAPFSLETRDDLAAHAAMIEDVVERGTMPPWFATPAAEEKSTPWLDEGTLAPADKQDLLAWLKGDQTEGDPRDAPLPMQFASGWTIGTPDLVAEFPKPIEIQANGFMDYQHVVVDPDVTEDKWVQRIEIRPGKPEVVHHALIFVQPQEESEGRRRRTPADGISYWGIYVPGNSSRIYPEGLARKLPKGSLLHFQMHYTPNGTATEDSTQVGFVFADREPEHEVKTASLVNSWFEIPPGDSNYTDIAKLRLPVDVTVLGFLPHMHLRGKACFYEAVADGNRETLLDIPRYDFNWQLLYRLAEPRTFTKGTTLKFSATFDNSAGNPANPDPAAAVRWGEQTDDEMIVGYVEYYLPVAPTADEAGRVDGPFGLAGDREQTWFTALDSDDDARLTSEEFKDLSIKSRQKGVPPALSGVIFATLDQDGDHFLTVDEFKNLRELLRKKR